MGVATLQAILRAVKHVRMLLIMFLKSKFIIFFELLKFYVFLLKTSVFLETISREMFYFIGYPFLQQFPVICKQCKIKHLSVSDNLASVNDYLFFYLH